MFLIILGIFLKYRGIQHCTVFFVRQFTKNELDKRDPYVTYKINFDQNIGVFVNKR